jgi:hypothetical protein
VREKREPTKIGLKNKLRRHLFGEAVKILEIRPNGNIVIGSENNKTTVNMNNVKPAEIERRDLN